MSAPTKAALTFGPGGSLFVVGGKTEYGIDWGTSFRDFWMLRFSERFEVEFEVHEALEADLVLPSAAVACGQHEVSTQVVEIPRERPHLGGGCEL